MSPYQLYKTLINIRDEDEFIKVLRENKIVDNLALKKYKKEK